MTTSESIRPPQNRFPTAIAPRGGLALLVVAHVLATFLLACALFQLPLAETFLETVVHGLAGGFSLAQWSLIAMLAALGSGRWYLRLGRCGLLLIWLTLAYIAGSHVREQGRDATIFEALVTLTTLGCVAMAVPPLVLRFATRRRFAVAGHFEGSRFQFRVAHLLLLTAEVAALLALTRATVNSGSNWYEKVLWVLQQLPNGPDGEFFVFAFAATVPPALTACWPARRWRNLVYVCVYEFLLATAWMAVPFLAYDDGPMFPIVVMANGRDQMVSFLVYANAFCFSATATIWLTIECVRLLGYDFLPLPRRGAGGGGRQSSEATSAA